MKNIKLLLSLIILLTSLGIADEIIPTKKIVYKQASDVDLSLHIFEPANHQATHSKTAIVYFFGGGWKSGRPEQFYPQAYEMAQLGVVGISAEYRVRGRNKTTPFEAVEDAKSAIRWVREHAAELGIDPNKIIASGGSAGGHLAVCTAVIKGLEAEGEDVAISSVPNAVLAYNPVLDTTAKGYGVERFTADQQTTLSPCHQVTAGIVPTMIFHGTRDKIVPFENAQRFVSLMKEAGNTSELIAYEGKGHGFFGANKKDTSDYTHSFNKGAEFLVKLGYMDEPPQKATTNKGLIRVTCAGDSNTAGVYPSLLQELLGDGWLVTNAGRGAATIIDGTFRPYHKIKQYQQVINSTPDKVIIMLGTNDANPKWWDNANRATKFDGSPAQEFKAGLLKLIHDFQSLESKPQVILATPLPIFPSKSKQSKLKERLGRNVHLVNDIIPIIKQVAQEQQLVLLDINTKMADQEENCMDGLHYNKLGHTVMAELFQQALLATQ